MEHEARVKTAIEQGGILSVIVIDDAFDPPAVGDEDAGPLMDLLTKGEHEVARQRSGLTSEEIGSAIEALQNTEYAEEAVTSVVAKIYAKYVESFESIYDPAGRFNLLKGSNLSFVRPLLRLLSKCNGVRVVRIGSNDAAAELGAEEAQVVFVDYYLDRSFNQDSDPDGQQGEAARAASIRVLRSVLDAQPGTGPSVMLMSSHAVADRAPDFRKEVRGGKNPIFASRFQYMAKEDLKEERDGSIEIAPGAADALLDIAQRHAFAGAIEDALTHWKKGVDTALESTWTTITELELKDFAYLSRFRLAEEGQPLSTYLEWFFSEVLVDAIARSVAWDVPSWAVLDAAGKKGNPGSQIEGAFDGPTGAVAKLYYRARVDERPDRQNRDMRVGDIYIGTEPGEVLAVVTPECDLVARKNGRRAAPRLTVVGGKLQPLSGPDTSVSDFLIRDNELVNVLWNTKDVRTIEYGSIGIEGGYTLLGTLRPLYAYELQRRVLNELGRIGLAVAPAMAINAKASVVVRGKDGPLKLELGDGVDASCAVLPKRGGTDKPRVIYRRSFVNGLLEKLSQAKEEVHEDAQGVLTELLQPKKQEEFRQKLLRNGQLDGELASGITTTLAPERTGSKAPWCQILVEFQREDAEPIPTDDEADASTFDCLKEA
ncbi:hypothetical protein [Amaricoccus sp.]|uniref:hypothetical protein n=1 Tax=Amaricoccus sp. TaxID=1872485 RepID=UPI002BEDCE2E|nr:hypothetical protein [Amaricoccus sp.]HMQ92625.1 hypothetical protein [Amaricoccus sp.]